MLFSLNVFRKACFPFYRGVLHEYVGISLNNYNIFPLGWQTHFKESHQMATKKEVQKISFLYLLGVSLDGKTKKEVKKISFLYL